MTADKAGYQPAAVELTADNVYSEILATSDVGQEMRLKGMIGLLDGAAVVKVPTVRLPENFSFMLLTPALR